MSSSPKSYDERSSPKSVLAETQSDSDSVIEYKSKLRNRPSTVHADLEIVNDMRNYSQESDTPSPRRVYDLHLETELEQDDDES